jgi:hypothetical protein
LLTTLEVFTRFMLIGFVVALLFDIDPLY